MGAKRAGYAVTAIDNFADQQTLHLADQAIKVEYNGGFNSKELIDIISLLDSNHYYGFIYGSGFEAHPELLTEISKKIPLIGNSADTVKSIKDPILFFSSLDQCDIRFPATFHNHPNLIGPNYLRKRIGGCGGAHVQPAQPASRENHREDYYYQEYIDGRSISLLFLANHLDIKVIGFNEQWINPSIAQPFRYGGAVSNIDLPLNVQEQLIYIAKRLSETYDLVGLNSLDVILKNNEVFVLEINPRLSATVELYCDLSNNWIEQHLLTCIENRQLDTDEKKDCTKIISKAQGIIYANFDCIIPLSFKWPDWVADTPKDLTKILDGDPLCSVYAEADNAEEAKQLVSIRVRMMQMIISKIAKKG